MSESQHSTPESPLQQTLPASSKFAKVQPVRMLCGFLLVLAIFASFSWSGLDPLGWMIHIRDFVLLWVSGWLVYTVLLRFSLISPTRSEHRFITTTILYLLFDPMLAWWVFVLLGVVTEVIQRFVRSVAGPIFNPAAAGSLVLALLGTYPGWWGVSFSPRLAVIQGGISVAVLLTLPVAGYIAYKYKKVTTALATLASFSIVYIALMQNNPLFLLIEGTLLFFVLVMVIEPKTSPILRGDQILFGVLVGGLVPVLLSIGFYEAYAGALLVANLGWYYKRFWHQKVTLKFFSNAQD